MIYPVLMCFVCLRLDILAGAGMTANERVLEIALLRWQLRILERKTTHQARLSRPEKLMLAALAGKLKRKSQRFRDRLNECVLLIKPATLLRWHCDFVRGKWTFKRSKISGRPRLDAELEALIVRMAHENQRMGYCKIQGELLKLGYELDPTTVRNVMRRQLPNEVAVRGGRFSSITGSSCWSAASSRSKRSVCRRSTVCSLLK
ncbi:MAG: hypothetical protein ACYDBJ_15160 [Aggregatilineales bacterium]